MVIPKVGVCQSILARGDSSAIICLTPAPRASVMFQSSTGDANWIIPPAIMTGATPRNTRAFFFYNAFRPDGIMWAGPPLPPPSGALTNVGGFRVLDGFRTRYPLGPEGDNGSKLIVGTPVQRVQVVFNFYSIRLGDYATSR